MKRRKVPKITLSQIKNTKGWWEPRLGWYVPSGSHIYDKMKTTLLCRLCYMQYDIYRQPYNNCKNCGTELILFRGPIYGKLILDSQEFLVEMVTNQVATFRVENPENYVNNFKVSVILQNAWPALIRGYRQGIYKGFYLATPRVNTYDIDKPPMVQLLSPFQASFYERFSLVWQGLEMEKASMKKYESQGYEAPQTFLGILHETAIEVDQNDMNIFTQTLELNYNQYLKDRNYLVLSEMAGE